jgi:AraC-like DNA-binding protein
MYYINQILLLLALSAFNFICAQDTLFVRSLPIDSHVNNIDSDGESLYLRFDKNVYTWNNDQLDFAEEGKFRYSWVKFDNERRVKVINHNNTIDANHTMGAKKMEGLLPGEYNFVTTTAVLGDNLYVCYNGSVLEYKIRPYITRHHKGNSIRHIYTEPGFRVISTYNGIFIDSIWSDFSSYKMNDEVLKYSNGEFTKIDSTYYLCQDNLIAYDKNTKDIKTVINTLGSPRIRKLIRYKNKVYALYNNAFGEVDLQTGTRYDYLIKDELSDFREFNGKLYISSLQSVLYELNSEGDISKYYSDESINDLAVFNNEIIIGTQKGLYALKDSQFVEVIPDYEIIQALPFENKIVFTNNMGLYCFSEGKMAVMTENVEFNKMALHMDEHFLYAGSVHGLYVIKKSYLETLFKSHSDIKKEGNSLYYFTLIFLLFISVFLVIMFVYRKKRQANKDLIYRKVILNSELVRNEVIKNPKILSVQHLAEHLNTSVVQLNRHLKKEDTSCLKVMNEAKKQIAREMHNKGKTIEQISLRTGYSFRYVKENFLKY